MRKRSTNKGTLNQIDIFQSVVESVHRATGLPVNVWAPDEKKEKLKIVAHLGFPTQYVQTSYLDLDKHTVVGDAFKYHKTQKVMDISAENRWKYKKHAKAQNWKAAIFVPIVVDGSSVGVMGVYSYTQQSINSVSQILSDAVKELTFRLEVSKQTDIRQRILNIGLKLQTAAKSPRSILNEIAKEACKLIGADCSVVYPYDTDRNEFYDAANVGAHGLKKPLELTEKPRSQGGMAAFVKRRGEVVLSDLAKQDPALLKTSPFIKREAIKAFMGIALQAGKTVLGVLYVNFRTPHKFTNNEKDVIRLIAHQAYIALNNERFHQQANLQIHALERLHGVGSTLTSILKERENLRGVLERIARNAQQVLGAELVDLYQYFEDQDRYDLPPIQIGERHHKFVIKDTIHPDDIVYKIVQGRRPTYTANAQTSKLLTSPFTVKRRKGPDRRFVIREKIISTAAIPLMAGNEVVGALFANYRSHQPFNKQQKKTLELYAAQAAIAIHNSRLYDESLLRSKRLELVRNVAAAVSSTTNSKAILQLAVNGLAKLFEVKQSAIAIFDEQRNYANIEVEYREQGCISAMGDKIPLKKNPQIDKILKTKKPLIIDDVENDPIMARTRKIMARRNTRSLMVAPIIIENEVVGTIGLDAVGETRKFTKEEADLAQAIADQTAIALRVAQQLDQRLKDGRALQEITEEMHQADVGAVLNLMAERAVELTGAKHGGVWLVNKLRTSLEFGGLANKTQYKKLPPNIPLDKNSQNSISKWVFLNRKSYISGNVRNDKNYKSWYGDTVSELTVPITYQGRVIGTINVESPKENSFTEDHRRLLEAMADQAAIMVQSAKHLDRFNALDEISVELTSGKRLEEGEILEAIYKQIQQLTGTQDMYIALYDERSREIRFPLSTKNGKRVEFPARKVNMKKRGMTEEIILTSKPILHKTKKEVENWYKRPEHQEMVGLIQSSWLGVPMLVGERVLGVIAIYDLEQEHAYNEQDLQVFSSMASQAAFALVNLEFNRRNIALAYLNEIGGELTSGIRLREEDILSLIFAKAKELTGAQDLYIALYDDDTREISFPRATEKGKSVSYPSRIANMSKRGKTDEIIFSRKPILHKTQREANDWYSHRSHYEFVGHISPSWLGVPMLIGERVLGVIAAVDLHEYAYDELDLEVLSSMASQAAIALQNARLYDEARGDVVAAKQLATLGIAIAALQHRINNTLNIIKPNIKRLRGRIDASDPTTREILDIIERNTRYTSDILLRIQTPLQEVELSSVDVNSLLSEIAGNAKKDWRKKLSNQAAKITLRLDESIPLLQLPLGQVSEIVRNLIDNAYRAMKKGGTLFILSAMEQNTVRIRFKDTAKGGIPPAIRARLFQKPVPSKEPGHGAGLGLWLSKLMLQGIGGDVTIEQTGHSGTTMLVEIPVFASGKEATV